MACGRKLPDFEPAKDDEVLESIESPYGSGIQVDDSQDEVSIQTSIDASLGDLGEELTKIYVSLGGKHDLSTLIANAWTSGDSEIQTNRNVERALKRAFSTVGADAISIWFEGEDHGIIFIKKRGKYTTKERRDKKLECEL